MGDFICWSTTTTTEITAVVSPPASFIPTIVKNLRTAKRGKGEKRERGRGEEGKREMIGPLWYLTISPFPFPLFPHFASKGGF
jgi:hypothetical protein